MPIYEYVCETCGNEFEVIQKFSDPELKNHDCAPKSKVHRKLSLTSFHLQGGGWYASGYGSGNGSGSKGSSGGSATTSESKSETKSEATVPAKTEAVSASAAGCGTACACH